MIKFVSPFLIAALAENGDYLRNLRPQSDQVETETTTAPQDGGKQCSLTFTPNKQETQNSVTTYYKDIKLYTHLSTTSGDAVLALPHPMPYFPDKVKLCPKEDPTTDDCTVSMYLNATDSTYSIGGFKVERKCESWQEILEAMPDYKNGGVYDQTMMIKAGVDKTSRFLEDSELGLTYDHFAFRGYKGKGLTTGQNKTMKVLIMLHGLNVRTDDTTFDNTDNGGKQFLVPFPEAIARHVEQKEEFIVLFVPVVFPKRNPERFMYEKFGVFYVAHYIFEAFVVPLFSALKDMGYKNIHPKLIGFSMGGIIGFALNVLMGAHKLRKMTELASLVLDPYAPEDHPCALKAITTLYNEKNMKSKEEANLVTHHRELKQCIKDKDGERNHTKNHPASWKPHNIFITACLSLVSPIFGWTIWPDDEKRADFIKLSNHSKLSYLTFVIPYVGLSLFAAALIAEKELKGHLDIVDNSNLDETWQHSVKKGLWGIKKAKGKTDSVIYYELGYSKGESDRYITLIGKTIHHDGKLIIKRLQEGQNTSGGETKKGYPKMYHINHTNDKTIGLQMDPNKDFNEVGYIDSGDWTQEKSVANTPYPNFEDPKVTFQCWWQDVGGQDKELGGNYEDAIDETSYKYRKMMYAPDSPFVVSLDPDAGSKNHHSSAAMSKYWSDPGEPLTRAYFLKHARMHTALNDFYLEPITKDNTGEQLCSKTYPKVSVERDNFKIDTESGRMKYTLKASREEKVSNVQFQEIRKKLEVDGVICNWLGKDIGQNPKLYNNLNPRDDFVHREIEVGAVLPTHQEQQNRCYTSKFHCKTSLTESDCWCGPKVDDYKIQENEYDTKRELCGLNQVCKDVDAKDGKCLEKFCPPSSGTMDELTWKYNDLEYSRCANPDNDLDGPWIPTPGGLDAQNKYIIGSEKFLTCTTRCKECSNHKECDEKNYCSKKTSAYICKPRKGLHETCQSDQRKCKQGLTCKLMSKWFWVNTTCEGGD